MSTFVLVTVVEHRAFNYICDGGVDQEAGAAADLAAKNSKERGNYSNHSV